MKLQTPPNDVSWAAPGNREILLLPDVGLRGVPCPHGEVPYGHGAACHLQLAPPFTVQIHLRIEPGRGALLDLFRPLLWGGLA